MPATVTMVTVRVLCFAQLRDRVGSECSLSVPEGTTGRGLIRLLQTRHASAAPMLAVARLAVNCEYVSDDIVLHDGDEVAVIPPVSGG